MHAVNMISTWDISVMVDQDWKISLIFNYIRNILFICKFSDYTAPCLMYWFALTTSTMLQFSHFTVTCPTH